jgi:hypothetical protein
MPAGQEAKDGGHHRSFKESAALSADSAAFRTRSIFMKLVTPLSTTAFVLVPAACKKLQHAAAQVKSLADNIADIVGASQTVMRERVEGHRRDGGDDKCLDNIGIATHRHGPESS